VLAILARSGVEGEARAEFEECALLFQKVLLSDAPAVKKPMPFPDHETQAQERRKDYENCDCKEQKQEQKRHHSG
jgi:hypothetical protein